jgi:hypothetical protein
MSFESGSGWRRIEKAQRPRPRGVLPCERSNSLASNMMRSGVGLLVVLVIVVLSRVVRIVLRV